MEFEEFLSHFKNVKRTGPDKAMALCPHHADKNPSLSIKRSGNKILVYDFAGCHTEDVLSDVGLKMSDLLINQGTWVDNVESWLGKRLEAIYDYYSLDGIYAYTKLRLPGKDFLTGIVKGDRFKPGLNGKKQKEFKAVYGDQSAVKRAIADGKPVFIVEGEKDVDTLTARDYAAFTYGSAKESCSWSKDLGALCKGGNVYILEDNDDDGKHIAGIINHDLQGVADRVKIINLTPEIEKGDVSDYFAEGHTVEEFEAVLTQAEEEAGESTSLNTAETATLTSMEEIEEKNPRWLISGYVPCYQISILAGDGGTGKTTALCSVVADISSGRPTFLEAGFLSEGFGNQAPQKVVYFSAEDSPEYTLKRRLRKNNANMKNIYTIDISDDRFAHIKFNDPFLRDILTENKPALCIFDPIQAFVPPEIHMGDRNAMRSCLAPLIGYGEKYGITFLIVIHSNKQAGVWGRKRIADSADIWDIARSVLMVGEANDSGLRYLSQEKSNYSMTENTVLFKIEDEKIIHAGYTEQKDREFVMARDYSSQQAPIRNEAEEFIMEFLDGKEHLVSDLDQAAKAMSISPKTLARAKCELKRDGKVTYRNIGQGKDKKFFIAPSSTPQLKLSE